MNEQVLLDVIKSELQAGLSDETIFQNHHNDLDRSIYSKDYVYGMIAKAKTQTAPIIIKYNHRPPKLEKNVSVALPNEDYNFISRMVSSISGFCSKVVLKNYKSEIERILEIKKLNQKEAK